MKTTNHETEAAEHCGECRYYLEYEDLESEDLEEPEDLTGICRRYPPVVIAGLSAASTYPDVSGATGWCGEYTPKL